MSKVLSRETACVVTDRDVPRIARAIASQVYRAPEQKPAALKAVD